jgi:hypothetical protein
VENVAVKKNKRNKLVLTVVNGVAKWVDASEATERFTGLRHERLPSRYLPRERHNFQADDLE